MLSNKSSLWDPVPKSASLRRYVYELHEKTLKTMAKMFDHFLVFVDSEETPMVDTSMSGKRSVQMRST